MSAFVGDEKKFQQAALVDMTPDGDHLKRVGFYYSTGYGRIG